MDRSATVSTFAAAAVGFITSIGAGVPVDAAESNVVALDRWSNVIAGEEVTLHFRMPPHVRSGQDVGWSVAVEHARIARRESEVRDDANGRTVLTVTFRLPEGESKTIVPVSIFVSAAGRQTLAKRLWLYPSDPFENPVPHVADNAFVLFDPEGATAARLENVHVRFCELQNLETLADLDSGLLVIGDGVSFRTYRGLPELMLKAAQRGVNVLCLAPAEGTLTLSTGDEGVPGGVATLSLARADVLTRFDKRLDYLDWRGNSAVGDERLQLISKSQYIAAEFAADGGGWPWLETEYASGGRIVIAGFRCIEHWESSPAPRHALWHFLAHTARPNPSSGSE